MAKAAQITFKEFQKRFSTEDNCRKFLFEERFPEGFVCSKCGGREYYEIRTRHVCQCKYCRHQTSVTAGTVMHRTHLPLTVWFWAMYLCATDKRGVSAKGLARQLEISYESAWYLLVRIRSAMRDRDKNYMLEGIVEMDESYLGAPKRGTWEEAWSWNRTKENGRCCLKGHKGSAIVSSSANHSGCNNLQLTECCQFQCSKRFRN